MSELAQSVEAAIREVETSFAPSRVVAEPDGRGGAHVIVERVPLGPPFVQSEIWVGAHLPAQLPYSDVYPVFVSGELKRVDSEPLKPPITAGHTFLGRSAVQISRRSNGVDLSAQSAAMKMQKVLHWMRTQR